MVCEQVHDMENELVYAYAKLDRVDDIETLISMNDHINIQECGDRCLTDI